MAKILFIEDDPQYSALVTDFLTAEKHVVEVADTGTDGLEFLKSFEYELLIVDWHLPDTEGPDLIKKLRASGVDTPIIMLTSRETMSDKEYGFDCGADDYLPKSANPRELFVRIRALLRRPAVFQNPIIKVKDIEIDVANHRVTKNGIEVHLLPKEFAVLEYLAKRPNRVLSAEELLERIWPSDTEATSHTVRSCVNKIRTKLDSAQGDSLIATKYKAGYQINQ